MVHQLVNNKNKKQKNFDSNKMYGKYVKVKTIYKNINNIYIYIHTHIHTYIYTGCPRRNVPDFGRVFLMFKYTDITQNTYVQS